MPRISPIFKRRSEFQRGRLNRFAWTKSGEGKPFGANGANGLWPQELTFMSWRLLRVPREKRKQQVTRQAGRPVSTQSFGAQSHSSSLELHRTLGNRRVAQLIQAKRLTPEGKIIGFQRKHIVSPAHSQYEQEADRVARQVVNTAHASASHSVRRTSFSEENKDQMVQTKPLAASITPFVQRQMETNQEWKEKEMPIQPMFVGTSRGHLQRQPKTDEDETKPVQAKSSGSMT